MNTITRYGKVVIEERDIMITHFTVAVGDGSSLSWLRQAALEWAMERIGDELYAIEHRRRKSILTQLAVRLQRNRAR